MRLNLRRLLIFLLILALSFGFGAAFDAVMTALEKQEHPMPDIYVDAIRTYAAEYGVPEAMLWAMIKVRSGFESDLVGSNGAIGLFQLSPERFADICERILNEGTPETGMLYFPEKNIECGAAYLSHLYSRFGVWETSYAAFACDEETVAAWLADPTLSTDRATLSVIPDASVEAFVREIAKAQNAYTALYFSQT